MPVVGSKELSTTEDPAVPEEPPTSTYEDVINLFGCATSIGVPSPAVHLRPLVPGTCNSQLPRLCEVKEERTVDIPGTRTIGTHTSLIAIPQGTSNCIEITQDKEGRIY